MGQMIDEDDCEVCVPFDQEWIFTYGDMVTLLLCFFILLVAMCKIDEQKLDQISESFKAMPPGSPFIFKGQSSNLDNVKMELEQMEMPDDVRVSAGQEGVAVTLSKTVAFDLNSAELNEKGKKLLTSILPKIYTLPNDILISGHTDATDVNEKYPSNWELSIARASAIATFFESKKIAPKRLQIAGFGDSRPRFFADTSYKRALNRRVEVLLLPEDMER